MLTPAHARVRARAFALACALLLALVAGGPARAQTPTPSLDVTIVFLSRDEAPLQPLSLADPVLTDQGIKGAQQAIKDNQTTGRFLGHAYEVAERKIPRDADAGKEFEAALAEGRRLFVADLEAEDLLKVTPLAEAAGAIVFNARATEDELRTDRCSAAVFHTAPSNAMKTDALAQYLAWKRWTRWFLVEGSHPSDKAFAEAVRRSAKKFGSRVVEARTYEDTGGARRTDTGHVQVQSQMPVFTQNAPTHEVVVVADASEVFGDYLPYRTWDPRPVVGTSGLVPTAWSRVHEQWGGTQMQRRFERGAGRPMTERDYNAWLAVRSIGEAVTRTGSADTKALHDHLVSGAFEVAGFKGQGLTFRRWDQQLRQPILLVTPRTLVSVSPQAQFLHRSTPLDTLGHDEPESRCRLNS